MYRRGHCGGWGEWRRGGDTAAATQRPAPDSQADRRGERGASRRPSVASNIFSTTASPPPADSCAKGAGAHECVGKKPLPRRRAFWRSRRQRKRNYSHERGRLRLSFARPYLPRLVSSPHITERCRPSAHRQQWWRWGQRRPTDEGERTAGAAAKRRGGTRRADKGRAISGG